jgi:hypothetical protein
MRRKKRNRMEIERREKGQKIKLTLQRLKERYRKTVLLDHW